MVEQVRTRLGLERLHPWANQMVHVLCNCLLRQAFRICRVEQLHLVNQSIEMTLATDMAFANICVANTALLAPPFLTQLLLEHIILENLGCCFNVVLPTSLGR